MKKYIFLAASALTLAACSNDDVPTSPDSNLVAAQVFASIESTQSRAKDTQWADNDQIGITTLAGPLTQYANIPYKYSNNAFSPLSSPIYFQSPEIVTFNAYYPFVGTVGQAPDVVTKTITADDQTTVNQPSIDYLFASGAQASKASPAVNFTGEQSFKHCMSRVQFVFSAGDDVSFTEFGPSAYKLSGLKMEGTFDTNNGTAAAKTEAQPAELTIDLNASSVATSVILFPQDITEFGLTVTFDSQNYHATLTVPSPTEGTLKAGYHYTYPIKVTKTGLQVGTADIKAWDKTSSDEINATM